MKKIASFPLLIKCLQEENVDFHLIFLFICSFVRNFFTENHKMLTEFEFWNDNAYKL